MRAFMPEVGDVNDLIDTSTILEPDLTAAEARDLTDRIRVGWQDLAPLITVAYGRRAWIALGYETWDAYCAAEMDGARLALPPTKRREQVAELRDAGLSARAIGSALGVSHPTVLNDLRSGGQDLPPEQNGSGGAGSAPTITGRDGRTYQAVRPPAPPHRPIARPDIPFRHKDVPGAERKPLAPVPPSTTRAAPNLDDLDEVCEERYRVGTYGLEQGLINVSMRLDPDPVEWFKDRRRPSGKFHQIPQSQDIFAPSGLRQLAQHLATLADYLDQTGETL